MAKRYGIWSLISKLPVGFSRRALFVHKHRRLPHFQSPATFNDKLNWRILNDRREMLEWTCDKLAMKEHVGVVTGLRVPRTLWWGSNLEELVEVELTEHWVLKPNHRSGQIFFGTGRPDIELLKIASQQWLRPTEAECLHEWAYSKARPVFFVEELLGVPGAPPTDYKFFVFAGVVAAIQVDVDRHSSHRRRIYYDDWAPLDVTSGGHPLAPTEEPPANLEEMLRIASDIGQSFDFVRVDLYSIDGITAFGEVTPYAGSGLDRFVPWAFDAELGAKWELPRLGGVSQREAPRIDMVYKP
jgi:hypothetical protein